MTDAQRRNLASAHQALVAQHEATILWQAAEISKHIDKIALLEAQLAEARRDSERYRWLRNDCNDKQTTGTYIAKELFGFEWDRAIDAAIAKDQG